ncbi:acid protease [Mycena albidolilacea]|uniref:Acid protease n=1 Tax=Mycena albidolilacea TaxID=1033008 RepID=A0AAD6YZV9_9AGAR|nr:acid protease [Mycena albidolilacea]
MNILSLSSLALALFCAVPGHLASPGTQPDAHHPALYSRSVLPAASYSVAFSKKVPRRKAKVDALAALRGSVVSRNAYKTVPLAGSNLDTDYLVNVTIGGQNFSLIIDSGSSDTWVPQAGFSCFDLTGSPVPQTTCNFGSTGFNPNSSKTFELYQNVSFNQTYGTSEYVAGPIALETVSIGALEVSRQVVPIPNVAAWTGDGVLSGVLGLAFPNVTSLFNTSDPTTASIKNRILYDPFFFTAVKQNKVEHPYFSIALNRPTAEQAENDLYTPNLGLLAFGGIAPVPVIHNTSVTVPVLAYPPTIAESKRQFFWYTLPIDSYNFPGSENIPEARNASLGNDTTVLDTGTAVNLVPAPVAAGYAAAFGPPAELITVSGVTLYAAQCNATVPQFSVTIGGQAFSMDPRDQLVPFGNDTCVLGTQAQGGPLIASDFHLLGDSFLRNVVATLNPIDREITLTQRVPY